MLQFESKQTDPWVPLQRLAGPLHSYASQCREHATHLRTPVPVQNLLSQSLVCAAYEATLTVTFQPLVSANAVDLLLGGLASIRVHNTFLGFLNCFHILWSCSRPPVHTLENEPCTILQASPTGWSDGDIQTCVGKLNSSSSKEPSQARPCLDLGNMQWYSSKCAHEDPKLGTYDQINWALMTRRSVMTVDNSAS
jgi:hypothetical protein